jgi:hypothetical protein
LQAPFPFLIDYKMVVNHHLSQINSFLGHGRAMETYLALVLITIGFQILMSPETLNTTLALKIYYYLVPHALISIPFFMVGFGKITGLFLNIQGYQISRWFRMGAAIAAMMLWLFQISNIAQEFGVFYNGAFPFYLWSFAASARLFYLGLRNLPRPGAPGQWTWPQITP